MSRPIHTIHITSDFKKSFRKLPRHIRETTVKKDMLFRQNAFAPSLRTHKLKGTLDGYWSYSVNIVYRILFRFISTNEVVYYDIGTHEIYRD